MNIMIIIHVSSHINSAAMSYAYCLLLSDRRKKYYERSVELLFKMVSHVHALKSSIPEKYI